MYLKFEQLSTINFNYFKSLELFNKLEIYFKIIGIITFPNHLLLIESVYNRYTENYTLNRRMIDE